MVKQLPALEELNGLLDSLGPAERGKELVRGKPLIDFASQRRQCGVSTHVFLDPGPSRTPSTFDTGRSTVSTDEKIVHRLLGRG